MIIKAVIKATLSTFHTVIEAGAQCGSQKEYYTHGCTVQRLVSLV